jgi:predicted ATPase/class 3 adenylate cyclase
VSATTDPLPTGAVTFLLTDIEGSTQAWQAAPGEMTALVSRHYDILESGIAAHHGRRPQEQGEGDSVVAVFTDPRDALAAAVETQLALREQLPNLPVRMALHTGDAMLRNENNYVGLTIIRCARIRSCGYGGQILLSDDTVAELGTGMPADVGVVDLGLYGLRGLDGRERIWQVTKPDLPATFPPLKAGASASGNLPAPVSSFVGRRSELASVTRSLTSNRLVTLVGEAGIGKSRLAHAAADAAANSMPGGVWWVGLSDVADDDVQAVSTAVMRSISLSVGDADPLDVVVDHFGSVADALLVIDGFDRARGATATLVERLLGRCPDTRILATGREPMQMPGEVVHAVMALTVPAPGLDGGLEALGPFDGTRLFLVRGSDHGVSFTDEQATEIAGICRDLRGVPLAIELAAARTATTPLAELAASVGLMAAGAGAGSVSLTSTLASSIAWTYRLLDADAQVALRRLAVFRGDFEIDAATEVLEGSPLDESSVPGAIRALFEQDLLTFDDDVERISIPPSIRSFAAERLAESPDRIGAIARHGSWFAGVAERFGDADSSMPISLLVPDEADVLAALEASVHSDDPTVAYRILGALGAEITRLGHPDVAERAANWLCTRTPSDGEARWAAAVARLCFDRAGHPAEIHRYADEARAISEMADDPRSVDFVDRSERRHATTVGTVHGDMASEA